MLHLIKMWLEAPVEETDTGAGSIGRPATKDEGRGTPQGAPISPTLSNLYMRRVRTGLEDVGHERRLGEYIVNYADDFRDLLPWQRREGADRDDRHDVQAEAGGERDQ